MENARAGTNFLCVFPDVPSRWTVAVYEKHQWEPSNHLTCFAYAPLVVVSKPRGSSGNSLYQMMTVPPHTGRVCLLVAFRNGKQQPYNGFTKYNPFGWHAFGHQPLKAVVAEMPHGTSAGDIRNYERLLRRQLSVPR